MKYRLAGSKLGGIGTGDTSVFFQKYFTSFSSASCVALVLVVDGAAVAFEEESAGEAVSGDEVSVGLSSLTLPPSSCFAGFLTGLASLIKSKGIFVVERDPALKSLR